MVLRTCSDTISVLGMAKDQEPSEFMGSNDIAKRHNCSRTHAWRLMRSGAFGPVVDMAREGALRSQFRVRRSGVEQWEQSRELNAS